MSQESTCGDGSGQRRGRVNRQWQAARAGWVCPRLSLTSLDATAAPKRRAGGSGAAGLHSCMVRPSGAQARAGVQAPCHRHFQPPRRTPVSFSQEAADLRPRRWPWRAPGAADGPSCHNAEFQACLLLRMRVSCPSTAVPATTCERHTHHGCFLLFRWLHTPRRKDERGRARRRTGILLLACPRHLRRLLQCTPAASGG